MAMPGKLKVLWYTWRSFRFPWRSKYFCGFDLDGNTYWEFKNRLHVSKPRRIVHLVGGNRHSGGHIVDHAYNMPPQWLQWLRATRLPAPTIEELISDLQRREAMKARAAIADAKWESKGRIIAGPESVESTIDRLGGGAAQRARIDGQGRTVTEATKAGEAAPTEVGTRTTSSTPEAEMEVKGEGKASSNPVVVEEKGKPATGEARERAEREIVQDGGDPTTKPEDPWAKADAERVNSDKVEGAVNLAPRRR
ncbi:hypothetical protein BJ508DRAFT_419073 [Ascobolus immersus RN42]|uniref:Uncharacterized protein n=1 Tax=Ascobolus immersus RN42 TaxID=1160509 RepID=A0A3N4HKC0_ASCIM|nr:hypothetical protein BJ508DRAFT_419073 [Ascobolus immersus RN42]